MKTKKIISISTAILMTVVVMLISGCVKISLKDPYYISDQYKPKNRQEIVLLATVNIGVDPKLDTNLDISGRAEDEFINRGYKFTDYSKHVMPVEVDSAMLDSLDFKWVKELKLKENTWVFVPVVESLKRFFLWPGFFHGPGIASSALLTGYLVEYPSGKVIFEGVGYAVSRVGVFLAALVDDRALDYAVADLLSSIPVNTATKKPENVSYYDLPSKFKYSKITGGCLNGLCDKSDKKAHICFVLNKSNSFLNDNEKDFPTKNKYRIYDTDKLIGTIETGQYICWQSDPGRTFVHLNMARPVYIRAEAGKYYYLNAKYSNSFGLMNRGWVFYEVPASESAFLLDAHEQVH